MGSMKRRRIIIASVACLAILLFLVSALFGLSKRDENKMNQIESIVDLVLQERLAQADGQIGFGDDSQINVLLLGLDGRIEDSNPHCDAIHFFTLDVENWNMIITSVPRGTYTYIPQKLVDTEYYLANACSYEGLDYGIEQIEKVIGVKADYVITVNFSQTLGILRLFDFPTTETLEWLRHRQSYQIGDPQRSHNQAVFIKDMIINHLAKFRSNFTLPMQYLLYTFVDTDMDFATASAILGGFVDSEIDARPDDIVLQMRPYYQTVDYHFDAQTIADQISTWQDRLRPYLSTNDLTGVTKEQIQASIIAYLQDSFENKEDLDHIVDNQLWLQVEDEQTREQLHYDFVELYAQQMGDPQEIIDFISLYILEKETLGQDDWAQKGKELLSNMIE
ncbi:MAG: LCP family protein [Patescibacteria group bacterium]